MVSNLTSEVYSWLASISGPGLNLERLAYEFESRGFRSKHSLKYLEKGDLEIIINSPQKLLLAEKKILEKELSLLQKTAAAGVPFGSCLEPKELFPTSSSWTTQTEATGSSTSWNMEDISAACDSASSIHSRPNVNNATQYPQTKQMELSDNVTVTQTQVESAKEQLENMRLAYDQLSGKSNGRRGKLCSHCHKPSHYKGQRKHPACVSVQICGVNEKLPEIKTEISELQKLVKELEKKESKASDDLQKFKLAKERSLSNFFSVMRPRLRRQNARYVDRFQLDKDLVVLKKILQNKIPIDESRDWEFPHLIDRYKRGMPVELINLRE